MTYKEVIKIINDLKIDKPELSMFGDTKLWKTEIKYYIGWNNALKEVKKQMIKIVDLSLA